MTSFGSELSWLVHLPFHLAMKHGDHGGFGAGDERLVRAGQSAIGAGEVGCGRHGFTESERHTSDKRRAGRKHILSV